MLLAVGASVVHEGGEDVVVVLAEESYHLLVGMPVRSDIEYLD